MLRQPQESQSISVLHSKEVTSVKIDTCSKRIPGIWTHCTICNTWIIQSEVQQDMLAIATDKTLVSPIHSSLSKRSQRTKGIQILEHSIFEGIFVRQMTKSRKVCYQLKIPTVLGFKGKKQTAGRLLDLSQCLEWTEQQVNRPRPLRTVDWLTKLPLQQVDTTHVIKEENLLILNWWYAVSLVTIYSILMA